MAQLKAGSTVDGHLISTEMPLSSVATNPNSDGIYQNVTYKRLDGTVYAKSTLTGMVLKIDYYDSKGIQLVSSTSWNLLVDSNGVVYSKELV